jgi:hypothetical protein
MIVVIVGCRVWEVLALDEMQHITIVTDAVMRQSYIIMTVKNYALIALKKH